MSIENSIVEALNVKVKESGAHPNFEDEQLAKYRGKPLKDLLKAISGTTRLSIDSSRPTHYGTSGYSGMANSVSWPWADLKIKNAKGGTGKLVDIYIEV